MAIVKRETQDEDWKTAIAQHKKPIPAGAEVEVLGITQNLYGDFVDVRYNGTRYSVKHGVVKVKPEEWEAEGLTLNGVEMPAYKIVMIAAQM